MAKQEIPTQKTLGKYEYSEYVACGARAYDCSGGPIELFWIVWLADGVETHGFESAMAARLWADKYCDNKGLKAVQ